MHSKPKLPATANARLTFALIVCWMSAGAPAPFAKITLWGSAGKSKVTDPPNAMVVVNGVKEKPGMETVAAAGGDSSGAAASSPQPASPAVHTRRASRAMRDVIARSFLLPVMALLGAVAAPGVSAQACLGLPAFKDASVHLNVAAQFPDSARSYAAGIGAGVEDGVFLNLGGAVVTYQGLDEQARLGFAEVGFQLPLGRVQICPIAGGYLGGGPDLPDFGLSVTSRGGSAGVALGLRLALAAVSAIPTASVKYEYLAQKIEAEDASPATETSHSGLLGLGLGLIYRERFTLQPLAQIPFATDDGAISFGVLASVILPLPVPGGFGR